MHQTMKADAKIKTSTTYTTLTNVFFHIIPHAQTFAQRCGSCTFPKRQSQKARDRRKGERVFFIFFFIGTNAFSGQNSICNIGGRAARETHEGGGEYCCPAVHQRASLTCDASTPGWVLRNPQPVDPLPATCTRKEGNGRWAEGCGKNDNLSLTLYSIEDIFKWHLRLHAFFFYLIKPSKWLWRQMRWALYISKTT